MGFYKNLMIEITDFYQEQLSKELERLPLSLDDFLTENMADEPAIHQTIDTKDLIPF